MPNEISRAEQTFLLESEHFDPNDITWYFELKLQDWTWRNSRKLFAEDPPEKLRLERIIFELQSGSTSDARTYLTEELAALQQDHTNATISANQPDGFYSDDPVYNQLTAEIRKTRNAKMIVKPDEIEDWEKMQELKIEELRSSRSRITNRGAAKEQANRLNRTEHKLKQLIARTTPQTP